MSMYRYTKRTLLREFAMIIAAGVWWLPFYILLSTSFKGANGLSGSGLSLPSPATFTNYSAAWHGATMPLTSSLLNSLIITVGTIISVILIGSVSAYVIGRRQGRFGNMLYIMFLVGIIVPFQLGVVPIFVALHNVGLAGSYLGMILLYTGMMMPLGVFLYTGFVRTLPVSYEEAAILDGASRARMFTRIVFPLLSPVTGTVAVLVAIGVWNDFFTQLIMLSGTGRETVPVAIYSFVGQFSSKWNVIFAAIAITILPVLIFYLFAQRSLMRGFSGGIRG